MMIEIIKAAALGVVEGVTEFLPISSTGHLILLNQWVRFDEPFTVMFDIVIQLGAIFAVIVYFWKRLWPFGKDRVQMQTSFAIWRRVLIGVLPVILAGAFLGNVIEETLFNPFVVAAALLIGGIVLLLIKTNYAKNHFVSIHELSFRTAFFIGLIQCLSLIPGTSRAAATIIGAMIFGTSRMLAIEFSFFLAIPTMVAASGYSVFNHGLDMTGSEFLILTVGFLAAFFVALGVIKFFIYYIQRHDFKIFGCYRMLLGTLILGLLFLV